MWAPISVAICLFSQPALRVTWPGPMMGTEEGTVSKAVFVLRVRC